jgi:hypothetical protein
LQDRLQDRVENRRRLGIYPGNIGIAQDNAGKLGFPERIFRAFAYHRTFFLGSPKLRRSVKKLKTFGLYCSLAEIIG